MKRIFLIVLDSFGIGALPDAEKFGDYNCNTLKRISESKYFKCENLRRLGLGNIQGVDYIDPIENPIAAYGRMAEASKGKDTTIGHWEIAGIITDTPLPTYPDGFPSDIIDAFECKTGRKVICNKPYSGTKVIEDYGKEHIDTGSLIVYTSADSVFQIAAHEDIVPLEELYEYCEIAREILKGEHSVGRVISRPFTGEYPNFVRTANRKDFSLKPTQRSVLDALNENSYDVISIGKINDIFAGCGITEKYASHSNDEGMKLTSEMIDKDFCGLCFTNLVDFDMKYGHRQDIDGYAKAIAEFDAFMPQFINKMNDNDLLIITADHGCDPGDSHTDHTREYVPLMVYSKNIIPNNLGTRTSFADIAASISKVFDLNFKCIGKEFIDEVF